jgi:hypothetical protein
MTIGSIVSPHEYFVFLQNLKKVHDEAQVVLKREIPDLLEVENTIEFLPDFAFQNVITKIDELDPKLIFVYEAAKRTKLNSLAENYLRKWKVKFERKIAKKDFDTPGAIDTIIQNIIEKIKFPVFKNPGESEKEMHHQLKPLAKEILYRKFHKEPSKIIPEDVFPLFYTETPNSIEQYLIDTYSPLLQTLDLDNKFDLNDVSVQRYMERFPKLEILNLSNCPLLTDRCLQSGHPTLKELILTGTIIKEIDIPKHLFPKLETVIQDKVIVTFNLDTMPSDTPPSEIKASVERADYLIYSDVGTQNLLKAFEHSPSVEGAEALRIFREKRFKQLGTAAVSSEASYLLDCSLVERFITAWKECSEDWQNPDSFGPQFTKFLQKIWNDNFPDGRLSLSQLFYGPVNLDITVSTSNSIKEVACISLKDVKRIRFLLKSFKEKNSSMLLPFHSFDALSSKIANLDAEIFKNPNPIIPFCEERPREIFTAELLNEIFVELSYWYDLPDAGPFMNIRNPSSNSLGIESARKNLVYGQQTDHTLASAFVFRLAKEKRKTMLENFLKNFYHYKSHGKFYPLQKIVLGVVESKDIPEWDSDSPLKHRLLNYEGVFCEDISTDTKQLFWKALFDGGLGGLSKTLIDAIVLFYNKRNFEASWRAKVKEALRELKDSSSLNKEIQEVREYAGEKLNSLLQQSPP